MKFSTIIGGRVYDGELKFDNASMAFDFYLKYGTSDEPGLMYATQFSYLTGMERVNMRLLKSGAVIAKGIIDFFRPRDAFCFFCCL